MDWMRDGRVCHIVVGLVWFDTWEGEGTYILQTFTPSTESEVPEPLRGGLGWDIVYPNIECIQQLEYIRNSLSIIDRSSIIMEISTSLQTSNRQTK